MQKALKTGPENRVDAPKQRPRRQPCCGFCRNHQREVPVINHHCEFANCKCPFCELTRRRRKIMCHQQRLWRYKKFSAEQRRSQESNAVDEATASNNFNSEEQQELDSKNIPRREMVCDKCRNHNQTVKKRGHKGSCQFEDCTCKLCIFTIKRQELMKHQQRVRRSQIASTVVHSDGSTSQPLTNVDSPDSDLQSVEEVSVSPTSPPRSSLEEWTPKGSETSMSPPVPATPHNMPQRMEFTSPVNECASVREEVLRPQDNHFQSVTTTTTTTTCPPPPLEPMMDYSANSDIHSPITFCKNEHNMNSVPILECPGDTRLSVRCGGYGRVPQVPAISTTLSSFPTYGHRRFVPWSEGMSETDQRCRMEVNNTIHPQAPLRPQPLSVDRLPRPQMDWHQFIGYPYPSASMLQSVPQPTLSTCDNFRPHHPQVSQTAHWQGSRDPHPTDGNGVYSPYSAGIPYFASALLNPNANSSLSLLTPNRTLPDYGSSLPEFRQRDQHPVNHFEVFTRSYNNVIY